MEALTTEAAANSLTHGRCGHTPAVTWLQNTVLLWAGRKHRCRFVSSQGPHAAPDLLTHRCYKQAGSSSSLQRLRLQRLYHLLMSLQRAVSELRSGPVLACCSELQKRLLRTSAASQARNPSMHRNRNAMETMPDAHYGMHGCLSVIGLVALPTGTTRTGCHGLASSHTRRGASACAWN